MSAFNPFPFISGAQEAAKGYSENRALDDILKQSKQARSPIEQSDIMSQVLQRLPPDKQQAALSYLKDRASLGSLQEFKGGAPVSPPNGATPIQPQGGPAPQPAPAQTMNANVPQQTAPTDESDFLAGTSEAIDNRARQLIASQPYRYRDPETARAEARKQYETQQNILSKTELDFQKALETKLQKEAKYVSQDIPGDMKEEFLKKAKQLAVGGKMSPEKIADKMSSDLLDFAKARTNLEASTVPSLLGLSISGKDAQAKIAAIRKEYESNDKLELFEDDLVNKTGLSTGVASLVAFPLSRNKDIAQYAKDTKKKISLNPFSGSKGAAYFSGIKNKGPGGSQKRTASDIGDYVSDHLKNTDNLNAIATAFNAKGYDPQQILNVVQKKWDEGKISLTKRQQRDLQKRTNFGATLIDLAYFSGTGLNPMEIVNE